LTFRSNICQTRQTGEPTEDILEYSVKELLDQNNILYQEILNTLSNTQLSFLTALSKGTENFNSKEVLQNNNLGTSGNLTKIKKTLINKEIIDFSSGKIVFPDPVFRLWLLRAF
jgi:hypothetical protein